MTGRRLLPAAAWLVLSGVSPEAPALEEPPPGAPASPAPAERVVGPPRGRAIAGSVLDARTEDVAGLLRCPVCQGLSVADSPATMAVSMKAQVREMLAAGYEEEQVLSYFERSYGEFVRLRPPLRGVNWLVWLAPGLALLAGGGVVAWILRASPRRSEPPAAGDVPSRDTLPADADLARHVLRVRALAYGWPDGRSPASAGSRSTSGPRD